MRAAAGLEVVRGAGYIPDDFEAPDRRRDEAPARQLPQDGRAARFPGRRGPRPRGGRRDAGQEALPPEIADAEQVRRAGGAERDAFGQLVDDARREARRLRDDAVRLRAERDFTNIRRAPVEHEAALDVALEERVRRNTRSDGAGVAGPRDREPRPRPRELLRAQIPVGRLSDDRGAVALLQQRVDARRRRRVALHEDDGQVDRLGRLVSDVDRRW